MEEGGRESTAWSRAVRKRYMASRAKVYAQTGTGTCDIPAVTAGLVTDHGGREIPTFPESFLFLFLVLLFLFFFIFMLVSFASKIGLC